MADSGGNNILILQVDLMTKLLLCQKFPLLHSCTSFVICMCSHLYQYVYMLTPVVEEVKGRLLSAGFNELKERDSWKITPLGKVCIYVL